MKKKSLNPWIWQDRIGFVQANEVSDVEKTIYCAGQVSVDEDGELVHEGNMEGQLRHCFKSLETVLAMADATLANVVRITLYITDLEEFGKVRPVFKEILETGDCRPATSLIGVAFLFHPDALIEIEATAVV